MGKRMNFIVGPVCLTFRESSRVFLLIFRVRLTKPLILQMQSAQYLLHTVRYYFTVFVVANPRKNRVAGEPTLLDLDGDSNA